MQLSRATGEYMGGIWKMLMVVIGDTMACSVLVIFSSSSKISCSLAWFLASLVPTIIAMVSCSCSVLFL